MGTANTRNVTQCMFINRENSLPLTTALTDQLNGNSDHKHIGSLYLSRLQLNLSS